MRYFLKGIKYRAKPAKVDASIYDYSTIHNQSLIHINLENINTIFKNQTKKTISLEGCPKYFSEVIKNPSSISNEAKSEFRSSNKYKQDNTNSALTIYQVNAYMRQIPMLYNQQRLQSTYLSELKQKLQDLSGVSPQLIGNYIEGVDEFLELYSYKNNMQDEYTLL